MSTRKLSAASAAAGTKPPAASRKDQAAQEDKSSANRENQFSKRARRNADAYTGFVVMSALSTALTLIGTGLTVHSALRYGKSAGTEALLKAAGKNADQLFDRSGELTDDAKSYSEGVPGLYGMLQSIERRGTP